MNWFNQTFLPSLFSRYGANNPHWLTAKQISICTDYMVQNTMVESDGYTTIRHKYFTYVWEGRKVTLQYSSKNGCGTITFGSNAQEAQEASQKAEVERNAIHNKRIERLKNHPERLQKRIAELRNAIATYTADIEDSAEFTADFIEITEKRLAEAKAELTELED